MIKESVVLAVETSSRTGSVALGFGDKIVAETSFSGFMKHSSEIFPAIEGLLDSAGVKPDKIEQLYISNGPGSFTGLRIAVSIAKMMYLANSLKIAAVDSLDVIVSNAIEAVKEFEKSEISTTNAPEDGINRTAAVLDAKRGQFFIAIYNIARNGSDFSLNKVLDDSLMSAREFCEKVSAEGVPVWLLGDGLLYHRQEFQADSINFLEEKYWSPRAAAVYRIGREMARKNRFTDPLKLKPNYLCRPEIRIKVR